MSNQDSECTSEKSGMPVATSSAAVVQNVSESDERSREEPCAGTDGETCFVTDLRRDEDVDVQTTDTLSCHNPNRERMLYTNPLPQSVWGEYENGEIIQGRAVRPAIQHCHHTFTAKEMKKMCSTNESIETRHPHSIVYRNYLASKLPKKNQWKKGVVFIIIGMVMGIVGLVMFQSIAFFSDHRKDWLSDRVADAVSNDKAGKSSAGHYTIAFMEWVFSGVVLVVISMLLVKWQPPAGGSGVTDVMAYLNGVFFEKVFNIRTLAAKSLSCICAVSSGLPVGPEGPMIHIGAILGAGIGSGRSKSLNFSLNTFFSSIRNPRDHLDAITGGAAAGVAVAFGAPIGGLLFVFEEVATHWHAALTPLIFAASLTGCFVFGVLASQFEGWGLRHETAFGGLLDEATILFLTEADRYMYARDLVSAAVIGLTCSIFAVVFTKVNLFIARKRLTAPKMYKMMEPLVTLTIYLSVAYAMPLMMQCEDVPTWSNETTEESSRVHNASHMFITAPCKEENQFSASASLFWNPGETVIKLLFRKHDSMDLASLITFVAIYFIFSCFSCGMMISSGIVIPMLITGGGIGRLYGRLITQYIDDTQHDGVYAIIGAAGYFAGVSRLTVSLAVIMIELTSEKRCLLPIMVSVMVSKMFADKFGHSLYHGLLELRCVPFLDPGNIEDLSASNMQCFRALDIATQKVACLRERESVGNIISLLKGCSHQGFPVVSDEENGRLRYLGMLSRQQLHTLLFHVEECQSSEYGGVFSGDLRPEWDYLERLAERKFVANEKIPACVTAPRAADGTACDATRLKEDLELDLMAFADTSTITSLPSIAVTTVFQMFTSMGIRHLPVVNEYGFVVGIITRKDMLACRLQKKMLRSMDNHTQVACRAVKENTAEDDGWDILDYTDTTNRAQSRYFM